MSDSKHDELVPAVEPGERHRLPRRSRRRRNVVDLRTALQPLVARPEVLGLTELDPAAFEIGLLIKRARRAKGWTQAELAERANVTQGALSDIENGKGVDGPSYRVVRQIANAVEMDLAMIPRKEAEAASQGDDETLHFEPDDGDAEGSVATAEVSGEALKVFCSNLEGDEITGLVELARKLDIKYGFAPLAGGRPVCKIVSVSAHGRARLPTGRAAVLLKLSGQGTFVGATPVPGTKEPHVYLVNEESSVTIASVGSSALSFMAMPAEQVFSCLMPTQDDREAAETAS